MSDVVNMKPSRKEWLDQKIEKAKQKGDELINWAIDNPKEALACASAIGAGIWKGHRILEDHKMDVKRKRTFYDRRRGYYVTAKRKPTAWERQIIDERYGAGETYTEVLRDLKLI